MIEIQMLSRARGVCCPLRGDSVSLMPAPRDHSGASKENIMRETRYPKVSPYSLSEEQDQTCNSSAEKPVPPAVVCPHHGYASVLVPGKPKYSSPETLTAYPA
jgi:hypothetical protein